MNKLVFKSVDENGNDLELAITRPNPKQQIESQLWYNKAWRDAEKAGSILRRNLDDLATKHGLWDDEKRTRVTSLENEIIDLERKLRAGSTHYRTLVEAKAVALKLRELRSERYNLLLSRNSLDQYTAENHADEARLQYLTAMCTVYPDTGKPYFKSYDNFVERSSEKVTIDAVTKYLELVFSDQPKDEDQYEVQWLKKYNFVDSEGRLINSEGKLITEDNKLIDKNGRYIDREGNYVDKDGIRVTETGDYMIEFVEFDGV